MPYPIPPFLLPYIVSFVINLVVRQVDRFGETFDWAKFKGTVEERVRGLLPDWLFEDAIVGFISDVVDFFAAALSDESCLKAILEKVAAKDYPGAIAIVKGAVLGFLEDIKVEAPVLPSTRALAPEQKQKLKDVATHYKDALRETLVKTAV